MHIFRLLSLLTALVLGSSSAARAQAKGVPDACTLISTAKINSLLGCAVKDGKSTAEGKYCSHPSADNKVAVVVQTMPNAAGISAMFLKSGYETASKEIRASGRHLENYTEIHPIATGGENAYWMAGMSKLNGGESVVRCQFVVKATMVSIDTRGLPRDKVAAKLPEMIQQIQAAMR